ncbi:MAG: DUF1007 family protein [Spirochaetaceae bacterium]
MVKELMRLKILILLLLILSFNKVFAHPHIYINYKIEIIDDNFAMIRWTFDPLTSERNIYTFDNNSDGIFDRSESELLYDEGFKSVADYGYFIRLSVGDVSFKVASISSFSVNINSDRTLTYSFKIALPKFVDSDLLTITHFDTSYFIAFKEPTEENISFNSPLYFKIAKNITRPYYYDPAAPADINLDTSKPQPGWLKAYPTEVIISKEPISKSVGDNRVTLKEKLIEIQRDVYLKLSNYLVQIKNKTSITIIALILLLSFIYGIVHALGPGHRKVVISSYLLATKKTTIKEGVFISMLSALIHSGSGVLLIIILTKLFSKVQPNLINSFTLSLQAISYILLLILSIVLLMMKIIRLKSSNKVQESKSSLWLIFITSFFPCPGAITIMLFSITINMIGIGILTVLGMSLGIGITLSIISIITVKSKEILTLGKNKAFIFLNKYTQWFGLIILLIFSVFMVWSGSYFEVNSL